MPRADVCIEAVFTDLPLVERAKRVADAGFDAVEFWFYDMGGDRGIAEFGKWCADNRILINNSVVNSPDASVGGSLLDPADRPKYIARLKETIKVCKDIDCHQGITCTGNVLAGVSYSAQKRCMIDTLKAAADVCEAEGFQLFVEALNTAVDHHGYFLSSAEEGGDICRQIGSPRVKLLFDIYHMQIMAGNVIARIEELMDVIGHFHSAGVPGRHDLDTGELNYPNIIRAIDGFGYKGLFGLEYWPAGDEFESLKRMRALTKPS